MRFVVIGDATWDVTVLGGIPAPGADRPARVAVGPGGQGANVAVRMARRSATVTLVTAVADDLVGDQLRYALALEGVEVAGLPAARSGIVVSLVDAAGERAMLSDRATLGPAALAAPAVREALAAADWIHVSGYPLADADSGEALADQVGSRHKGLRCSVGGGSFTEADALDARLRTIRPDLVLFDRAEASTVLGRASAWEPASAAALAPELAVALGGIAVVTDGAGGATAATTAWTITARGNPRPVLDATGAGDAHAATFLVALVAGPWPPTRDTVGEALQRAGRVGAEVAGVVGAQAAVRSESGK